jgi:Ala-tRNA(Pro) deacylase
MATRRTLEFLDGESARYAIIHHSPAFSAQEIAASAHVPGRSLAKTVVVKIDGRLALAVVPANRDVSMNLLRSVTGAQSVVLAEPAEFANRFEGCQLGTEPPLGNLFGVETFVDRELTQEDLITFNAGSRTDVVTMSFSDYRRIARPMVANIAMPQLPGLNLLQSAQL